MQLFTKLKIDTPTAIGHPSIARRQDIFTGETSLCTGVSRKIVSSANGETIERFLNGCRVTSQSQVKFLTIDELSEDVRIWSQANLVNVVPGQKIACVPVEIDGVETSTTYAPEILFRLDSPEDSLLLPERDSSGAAVYVDELRALDHARNEMAERQSLCLFWYFDHRLWSKTIEEIKPTPCAVSQKIVENLSNLGTVTFHCVSSIHGYSSFLATLTNAKGRIKFAMGAAANYVPELAIKRASIELYQSVVNMDHLIHLYESGRSSHGLAGNYLAYNNEDTARLFEDLLPEGNGEDHCISTLDLRCIYFKHTMKFTVNPPHIHFSIIKPLRGFHKMNYTAKGDKALLDVIGATFGYNTQVREGPVPFA